MVYMLIKTFLCILKIHYVFWLSKLYSTIAVIDLFGCVRCLSHCLNWNEDSHSYIKWTLDFLTNWDQCEWNSLTKHAWWPLLTSGPVVTAGAHDMTDGTINRALVPRYRVQSNPPKMTLVMQATCVHTFLALLLMDVIWRLGMYSRMFDMMIWLIDLFDFISICTICIILKQYKYTIS